jgi:hypothetical protein
VEVVHKVDGCQDRGAHADLGDVLFDVVLAVEVRNACLSIGRADRGEDEMDAYGLAASAAEMPCCVSACVPRSDGVVIAKREVALRAPS